MPQAWGHWAAFWSMPQTIYGKDNIIGTGTDWSEIDFFEGFRYPDHVNHAIHYDGYGKDHKHQGFQYGPIDITKYHTFGCWWESDKYTFYVDGVQTWQTSFGGVSQNPQHILLTVEIGDLNNYRDGKVSHGIDEAKLPSKFLVDYVRVYDVVSK